MSEVNRQAEDDDCTNTFDEATVEARGGIKAEINVSMLCDSSAQVG